MRRCVTTTQESAQFQAGANQQATVQDGQAALVSRGRESVVQVRPATQPFRSGARPVFVVAINNVGRKPVAFRVSGIEVTQTVNGQAVVLPVITYDQLATEERNRLRTMIAVTQGPLYAAAFDAGWFNNHGPGPAPTNDDSGHSTTQGPTVPIEDLGLGYQGMAKREQQTLANMQRDTIGDTTVMPGQSYSGQLHLQPLADSSGGPKTYRISVAVGTDRHDINIVQSASQ